MSGRVRLLVLALLCLISPGCGPRSASGALPAFPDTGEIFPVAEGSARFAVIGDAGTGGSAQRQVADQLARWRGRFPYNFVLMLGDNLYGGEDPEDYEEKFELPYRQLLEKGVRVYAVLGNHDRQTQTHYRHFNMGGERFYSFRRGPVEFFALDSNYLDPEQLDWLEGSLRSSSAPWKIAFMHHPMYSSGGKHGSSPELIEALEPIFVRYGLDVVLAGHEHFYERLRPQKGIHYFISGAAAKLRRGNIRETSMTARGFDQDHHFVLMEATGEELHFAAVSREGRVVDAGRLRPGRVSRAAPAAANTDPSARPASTAAAPPG